MSRIGRKPIEIPADVNVTLDGAHITVKGPKGTLERELHKDMIVGLENNVLTVERPTESKLHRSLHGLTRTLIANMVEGVKSGFSKTLEINGVGYRIQKQGKDVIMNLGYSHQVIVSEIEGIALEVPNPNILIVSGTDKQAVGQFAANVREKRPPEPYKGKGIKYATEVIKRKEGKAGKGSKK